MIEMDKMQKLHKILVKQHEAALILRKNANQEQGVKVDATSDRMQDKLEHLSSTAPDMVAQEKIKELDNAVLEAYNDAKAWLSMSPEDQHLEAEHIWNIEKSDNPELMISDVIQDKTNDAKGVVEYYNSYSTFTQEQKFEYIYKKESLLCKNLYL